MNLKQYGSQLFSDVFLCSLLVYTSILFLELFKKGIISQLINTTVLFIIIAFSGVGAVLLPADTRKRGNWATWTVSVVAGLYIAFLMYFQTKDFGGWAYLFSLGALLVTVSCSIFSSRGVSETHT